MRTKSLFHCFLFLVALVMVTACVKDSNDPNQTPQLTESRTTPIITSPLTNLPQPTPIFPTVTSDLFLSSSHTPTSPSHSTSAVQSSTIPNPTATNEPSPGQGVHGTLFGENEIGIWQQHLPEGEKTYLLVPENDWLGYAFSFSPNGKWLAYWFKTKTNSEIWWSSLTPWNPQKLLTLPLYQSEIANFIWLVSDKYLLVELLDDFESPISIRKEAHLIDLTTQTIVFSNEQENPNNHAQTCEMLAISPKTDSLSLWCPLNPLLNQTSALDFVVLEIDGETWMSEDSPAIILALKRDYEWLVPIIWSDDSKLVSYTLSQRIEHLYYFDISSFVPIELLDYQSTFYKNIRFSPDNRLLAYEGECDGQSCVVVIELATQTIVWNSESMQGHNDSLKSYAWSPDSRYLAVNYAGENISIVDIFTNNIVRHIPDTEFNGMLAWSS